MRRVLSLLLFLFMFAGCSGAQEDIDRALHFRQGLLKQSGCRFACNLSADYGDILYQFGLDCQSDDKGNVTFTVTAPDSISGITGTISASGGKIKFDDSVLGFPILSEDLPTPLSAPWLFMTALRSGYIRTSDTNDGKLSLTIADTYDEDAILLQVQFNNKEVPVACGFIWKGRQILSMKITSFTYL